MADAEVQAKEQIENAKMAWYDQIPLRTLKREWQAMIDEDPWIDSGRLCPACLRVVDQRSPSRCVC